MPVPLARDAVEIFRSLSRNSLTFAPAKFHPESDALGDAGDIDIDARGSISVNAGGILTSAKQSDGGNIRLSSGRRDWSFGLAQSQCRK